MHGSFEWDGLVISRCCSSEKKPVFEHWADASNRILGVAGVAGFSDLRLETYCQRTMVGI